MEEAGEPCKLLFSTVAISIQAFPQMYEQSASPNDKIKKALLLVVRRHLTAPPSSTNVERWFSYGGLVATDHRASLAPEKLDQVLFLRENALMANFDLGWL